MHKEFLPEFHDNIGSDNDSRVSKYDTTCEKTCANDSLTIYSCRIDYN